MMELVIISSAILAAAVATLMHYRQRTAKATQAIERLEADIARMNAENNNEQSQTNCKRCSIVSLDDNSLSLAAAAGKPAPNRNQGTDL